MLVQHCVKGCLVLIRKLLYVAIAIVKSRSRESMQQPTQFDSVVPASFAGSFANMGAACSWIVNIITL